jgi:ketosteroid isomerase-like protein
LTYEDTMSQGEPDFAAFMLQRGQVAQAYVNGDAQPLSAISAHESPVTFFPPSGGHEHGPERVLEINQAGAQHFAKGSESKLEILHQHASGDLGYWVGLQHAVVQMQGKKEPVRMQLRITELFRREAGEWKLLHRHADMLAEKAEPKQ